MGIIQALFGLIFGNADFILRPEVNLSKGTFRVNMIAQSKRRRRTSNNLIEGGTIDNKRKKDKKTCGSGKIRGHLE